MKSQINKSIAPGHHPDYMFSNNELASKPYRYSKNGISILVAVDLILIHATIASKAPAFYFVIEYIHWVRALSTYICFSALINKQ